jgi:hypothetical protein
MASNDRRFGFSVVGGVDEGVRPRVDDVQPGKCEVFHNTALRVRYWRVVLAGWLLACLLGW